MGSSKMHIENIAAHVLVTRFNLRFPNLGKDKFGKDTLAASWMQHRLNIFRHVCAPSVAAQTVQDFDWLVLIDPKTSPDVRKHLDDSARKVKNFFLVESAPYPDWREIFKYYIDGNRPLIQTRMDNDDAIAPEFISSIQKLSTAMEHVGSMDEYCVIDFSHGVEFDGENFFLLEQRGSNFSSIFIKNPKASSVESIYDWHHREIIEKFTSIIIRTRDDRPMWCQSIHDRNAKNVLQAGASFDADKARRRFGIAKAISWSSEAKAIEWPPGAKPFSLSAETALSLLKLKGPPGRTRVLPSEIRAFPSMRDNAGFSISFPAPICLDFGALFTNPSEDAEAVCVKVKKKPGNGSEILIDSKRLAGGESCEFRFHCILEEGEILDVEVSVWPGSSSSSYMWPTFRDPYLIIDEVKS